MNKKNDKKTSKNPLLCRKRTIGQKAADDLAKYAGSWGFIVGFGIFLLMWVLLNIYAWVKIWDPYPFILLNLFLSCLAAIQAPIILMSQNRAAERDRLNAKYDYQVNRLAEREIRNMQSDLDEIKDMLRKRRK